MKTYKFSEVIDFLKDNQETVFHYSEPNLKSDECCLMASFFKSKGHSTGRSSFDGTKLIDGKRGEQQLAEIVDGPRDLSSYHENDDTGGKILERLEESGITQTKTKLLEKLLAELTDCYWNDDCSQKDLINFILEIDNYTVADYKFTNKLFKKLFEELPVDQVSHRKLFKKLYKKRYGEDL